MPGRGAGRVRCPAEKPPTTLTSQLLEEHRGHLDPDTIDLMSMRDKGEVKDIVAKHLATSEAEVGAAPRYNPAELIHMYLAVLVHMHPAELVHMN